MKKLTILIILTFISMSLKAQETKITITEKDLTISQAFEQIEAQTKYTIAYNQTKFNAEQKLTKSIKDATIEKTLTSILKGTGFTYKISASHIVIKEIEEPLPSNKRTTQKPTETIRGIVRDATSEEPIPYASVAILNTNPLIGTSTDSLGVFRLDNIPVGRYNLEVTAIGYEPAIIKEVLVTSAKESYNTVVLKERLEFLDAAVVRPKIDKEQPLNPMSLAGGRMFSIEEASRYAGGFDDPARLVTSFAGVSGSTSSTSISIHGNSPQFTQWTLEGIEIPNPAHFGDIVGIGGGIITAFSSQVMGNSDFFNGAFPAQYSNALAGVFDMSLRNGNNQEYEHTVQAGLLGVDIASEGPISKKQGSSYIVNYRYFLTGHLMHLLGNQDLKFQDLSFKLNFPTSKAGTFSIWGFGLTDVYFDESLNLKLPTMAGLPTEKVSQGVNIKKFATGIGHKIFVGKGAYLKTSLALTYFDANLKLNAQVKEDNEALKTIPVSNGTNQEWNLTFSSYLNKKFSARHTNRTGITVTGLFYKSDYNAIPSDRYNDDTVSMGSIVKGNSSSSMISAYSNSLINITDQLSTNIGITSQFFTLTNSWSIEPRLSLKYKMAPRHSIALAYGLHSRRERLDYYYSISSPHSGDKLENMDLSFARAHHLTLSYEWNISNNINLRVEPYYQYLYDIPVEIGTPFSIMNFNSFFLDRSLVNKGKGQNYGIDVTLEQYLNKGFYWLFTGTFFDSKYLGGDNIWRSTLYNRKYIINALIGKEWMCGRQKQNVFSANIKFLFQGGRHYTPVNEEASHEQKTIVLDEAKAYSKQYSPSFIVDFTLSYKLNRRKTSHEFAIKMLNATGTLEPNGFSYNKETNTIEPDNLRSSLPNISYKLYF